MRPWPADRPTLATISLRASRQSAQLWGWSQAVTLTVVNYGLPLRIEFLIPGAATVVSTLWLIAAIGSASGHDPIVALTRAASRFGPGSVQAVVVLLVMIATAYGAGVVIVMGTFVWPASRLVHNARARRLSTLQGLQSSHPDAECPLRTHLDHLFEVGAHPRKPDGPLSKAWWQSNGR